MCAAWALLAGAHDARAQASATIGVDSDYRFRGVSFGGNRPSLRAEVTYDAAGGWYAGASGTRAEFAGDRYLQASLYAGRVIAISPALDLDVGASGWVFSRGDYNFAEVFAGLVARSWSLRANYSPGYFGQRNLQTVYVDASAQHLLTDTVRAFVHAGELVANMRTTYTPPNACANVYSTGCVPVIVYSRSRWDVRAGIGWNVTSNVDLQLAWTRVAAGGPFPSALSGRRGGPIASVSLSF